MLLEDVPALSDDVGDDPDDSSCSGGSVEAPSPGPGRYNTCLVNLGYSSVSSFFLSIFLNNSFFFIGIDDGDDKNDDSGGVIGDDI